MTKPKIRIHGCLAVEANKVVLFRTGPRRVCQMLLWDLDTDEITSGQWINAEIYPQCSDVTPDGRYVVVTAVDRSEGRRARTEIPLSNSIYDAEGWAAVSRPPYFSALAVWFGGSNAPPSGSWLGDCSLALDYEPSFERFLAPDRKISVTWPSGFSRDRWLGYDGLGPERLLTKGWTDLGPDSAHLIPEIQAWLDTLHLKAVAERKSQAAALQKYLDEIGEGNQYIDEFIGQTPLIAQHFEAVDEAANRCRLFVQKTFRKGTLRFCQAYRLNRWSVVDLEGVERKVWLSKEAGFWLEVDRSGRLVFAEKGCLWAWPGFPEGEPVMVADLRENKFEQVPPPDWAKEW